MLPTLTSQNRKPVSHVCSCTSCFDHKPNKAHATKNGGVCTDFTEHYSTIKALLNLYQWDWNKAHLIQLLIKRKV